MNLEEYEEQLTNQATKKDTLQQDPLDVDAILRNFERHLWEHGHITPRDPAYWNNIGIASPPVWQREIIGQWIPGGVGVATTDPALTTRTATEQLRQTGRTTRMIFQALIAASEGITVHIVAHNHAMARQIQRMVESAARSLNWNGEIPQYVYRINYTSDEAARMGRMHVDGNSIILYDNAIEDMRNGL